MMPGLPSAADMVGGTRTTTGTLVTVPAGRWLTADITLSAAVGVAGSSSPTVTVQGAGAAPASGAILHRVDCTGLLGSAAGVAANKEILVRAPEGNSITLEFTAGASGTSSVSFNGYFI